MNAKTAISRDAAIEAFNRRDRSFDGSFVVAVKTTGIYCRPSCPARRPRPENIEVFEDATQALQAGYRACKRCLPDECSRDEAAVAKAIAILRESDSAVPLAELAQQAGYSPSHFQRVFNRALGLSPAAFARALRLERAGEVLSGSLSVTGAVYEAGYGSSSRFYEASKGRLGMTPSAWAAGGRGVTIRWQVVETSLGAMLVAATAKGICRLSFKEGSDELARRFPNAELAEGDEEFASLLAEVVAAVENPGSERKFALDVAGTAFQEAVWAELRKIPKGETRSYGEIAAAIGKPRAVRAAGAANGANPVAVLVPCHRVVRSDGSLGGYAYGEEIKRELLERESKAEIGKADGLP